MIILGIDPGTAMTGYGLIECTKDKIKLIKHGSIKTLNDHDSSYRLNLIYEEAMAIIKKHKPSVLAIESLFFAVNVKSASAVGQSIGVIKLAAAKGKMKVFEYPPLKIKMKLVGSGRAEKSHVQSCVRKALRLRKIPRPNHAADALAAAICHWLETNPKQGL
jgi:crossover junction endodeoxyribonuclease RuvC